MQILSRKYKRGHRSHDNMGPEYVVLWPLFFGYYWCRDSCTVLMFIKHERDLA